MPKSHPFSHSLFFQSALRIRSTFVFPAVPAPSGLFAARPLPEAIAPTRRRPIRVITAAISESHSGGTGGVILKVTSKISNNTTIKGTSSVMTLALLLAACSLVAAATLVTIGALATVTAPQAFAHHASVAEFDMDKEITLSGVISKVDWINPHVYIHLDVKDANGAVTTWALESLPTRFFHNMGLTREMLGEGQAVTVTAKPAKVQEKHLGWVVSIKYPDGHAYDFSGK
jgi:Family of unknown function (DUF6152)